VAAVVGGGDWALQEALTLADHAARVILVHQAPAFSAQQTYQLRVLNHPIIEVRHHTTVEAVLGETSLARIQLRDGATGTTEDLPVAGLFVYTGVQPNTGWLADHLPLTDSGHIQTDGLMRTVQPGLLAAGDVRQHAVGYALTAAADGATAAIAAHQYLVDGAWPAA
jgi:thioredoxin reductase (NADPH)